MSRTVMTCKYRSYTISYCEENVCNKENLFYIPYLKKSFPKLIKAKQAIDRLVKGNLKSKDVQVIWLSQGIFHIVNVVRIKKNVITIIDGDARHRDIDINRMYNDVYENTEVNKKIIEAMFKKEEELDVINRDRHKLFETLVKVTEL